jgi:hypothetical protein
VRGSANHLLRCGWLEPWLVARGNGGDDKSTTKGRTDGGEGAVAGRELPVPSAARGGTAGITDDEGRESAQFPVTGLN